MAELFKEKQKKEREEKGVDTGVVARMAKRLAELGENAEEIVKMVEGGSEEAEGERRSDRKRARMGEFGSGKF